jgi:hypothetical protein
LQNLSQTNGETLKNVRCENSKTFRKNRENIGKKEINDLETNRTKISETYIEP